MAKVRVRFGIRLVWPVANIAIFVVYLPSGAFEKLLDLTQLIRDLLVANDREDIAGRIVCEPS